MDRDAHNFFDVVFKGAPENAAWYSHFMRHFPPECSPHYLPFSWTW